MGIFNFFKDAGKKILGQGDDSEAIKKEIEESFGEMPIDGLVVEVNDGTVILAGVARDNDVREKAILIAGNVEGVEKVDATQLVTPQMIEESNERDEPEPTFYTIQKGDTLWKIAEKFYNDGTKHKEIFEANLEVIKDPNKIYPGQSIRIPNIA
ncbi:MAG: peptidoglycan-binding protein LysM [Epsilonproteobacteria bacterium]|nr:peptidoglycan-binding protein LysM [Campylobacterota bacterium]